MAIDSILVAFEIPNVDFECYSNESRYKKLIKDIFERYPKGFDCLDSYLNICTTSNNELLLYFLYLGVYEKLTTQPTVLNSFKKEVTKLITEFLNEEEIPHRLI